MKEMIAFYGFLIALLLQHCSAERTRDKMYQPISGASCFRRLNATHQTGCSSPFFGSVGVLHVINTTEDIDFLVNNPPAPPYAPVISPSLFTRENVLRIKNDAAKFVSAMVLIYKGEKVIEFSHELKCPNQFSSLMKDQTCDPTKPETTWNPHGTGLLHEDYPFPIYYVDDKEEIEKIEDCFNKFNKIDLPNQKYRSLCSIQINSVMSASVNSEVCIRRTGVFNNLAPTKFCDPLNGRNIYTTLYPRPDKKVTTGRPEESSEKFILVSARMDTTSFFDGVGLGAMDSLVSFATLVSLAHMLATVLPGPQTGNKNVLFMLFNGESYDFIGSQRFVYDLQMKNFPSKNLNTNIITLEDIELMIDIGTLDDLKNIKIYYETELPHVKSFVNALRETNLKFNLSLNIAEQQSSNLPPTSAQSFLRENVSFPIVIVTSEPKNKFYHSIYDDTTNIQFKYQNTSKDFTLLDDNGLIEPFSANSTQILIRNTASALAITVYYLLTYELYTKNKVASSVLIDEFLYCFLESADCPLFKAASPPNSLPGLNVPPLRYISVVGGSQDTALWTSRIMGYLIGDKIADVKKENCTHLPLHWFAGFNGTGECRLTKSNGSLAYSPAFTIDGYDWKSGKYSTWTESTWLQMSARIFLQPSKTHEAITLAIGVVVMIISFIVVYLINSRSDVLFGTCPSSSPITTPAAC